MPDDCQQHLRVAAHEVDESHVYSNFREDYVKAGDADAVQKRAAADEKKKTADEWLRKLQEFEPILNLEGKTVGGDLSKRMLI